MYVDNEIYREDLVRQIRCVGESLIKNAESIAGTEEYVTGIDISASLNPGNEGVPEIDIVKHFLPEQYVKFLNRGQR